MNLVQLINNFLKISRSVQFNNGQSKVNLI